MIRKRRRTHPDERGQVIFEFIGVLPVVLAGLALCLQGLITVVAYERVHNAARSGARIASMGGDGREAAREALPGWLVEQPSKPPCDEGETSRKDGCLETYKCVEDGQEKPWETTCFLFEEPATITVRTEIPLLFPGAPLVIPIESTVEMPA